MAVEARRRPREALADAAGRLAAGLALRDALELIAAAAAEATGAELAVVRVLDPATGELVARAVAPADSPLGAETAGSRSAPGALGPAFVSLPVLLDGRVAGALELVAPPGGLSDAGRAFADLAAAQLALTLRQVPELDPRGLGALDPVGALEGAGEALAAGATLVQAAEHAARVAAEATGAIAAAIWRRRDDALEPLALSGDGPARPLARARPRRARGSAVADGRRRGGDDASSRSSSGSRRSACCSSSTPRRRPPTSSRRSPRSRSAPRTRSAPAPARATSRSSSSARARSSRPSARRSRASRSRTRSRPRSSASPSCSASTASGSTSATAPSSCPPPAAASRAGHEDVAWALLELALGPLRARDTIELRLAGPDPGPPAARRALRDTGAEAAVAVPLRVHDEPIGLLVAYPGAHRLDESERTLLAALAAQLAVAVQNARLHEQTKELGDALAASLESERQAARQLVALYEISRSFAQTPLARDDAARGRDDGRRRARRRRGRDPHARRARRVDGRAGRARRGRAARGARPRRARAAAAARRSRRPRRSTSTRPRRRALGGAHALLVPFLRGGSTAAVLPISTPAELLAELTIVSLDGRAADLARDRRRRDDDRRAGRARDRQRAPLPAAEGVRGDDPARAAPARASARARARARRGVRVGGARRRRRRRLRLRRARRRAARGRARRRHRPRHRRDRRHGDGEVRLPLARARAPASRARSSPHANEVVAADIAPGKFITMTVARDRRRRRRRVRLRRAIPRRASCSRTAASSRSSAAGSRSASSPASATRRPAVELPSGAAVVLYTDGVVEARRDRRALRRRAARRAARRRGARRPRRRSPRPCSPTARRSRAASSADDCAVVVVKVA